MQKLILLLLISWLALPSYRAAAQDTYKERVEAYIETHKEAAIREQRRSGIPAAIKLGQGVLETGAGNSRLCLGAHNHFGIKCKKNWTGETFAHTDDALNECFRKYDNPEASYTDHSDFLRTSPRYSGLFDLDIRDYKGWANGLKKCGYATNPNYARQLIRIIEEYDLSQYTDLALTASLSGGAVAPAGEVVPEEDEPVVATVADTPFRKHVPAPAAAPEYGSLQRLNGIRGFYAAKGDVLLEYAFRHKIRYARLLELNDLPDAPLQADMFIYLDRKHTRGPQPHHTVQQGESLLQIAQATGMQLKYLRTYNRLAEGEDPAPGTLLYLQQPAPRDISAPDTQNNYIYEPEHTTAVVTTSKQQLSGTDEQHAYLPAGRSAGNPAETTAPVAASHTANMHKGVSDPANAVVAEPRITEQSPAPVTYNTEQAKQELQAVAVNIADEVAVEEEPEPQDELGKLKAKLDRIVYSEQTAPASSPRTAPATTPAATAKPIAAAATQDASKFHTVKKGETAFGIAKRYGITMVQLREWNDMQFEALKEGQKLRIKP